MEDQIKALKVLISREVGSLSAAFKVSFSSLSEDFEKLKES
jgi:hypothetical protein